MSVLKLFDIGKDTEKNVQVTMAYDRGNGQYFSSLQIQNIRCRGAKG
ncbi:hypothetical protein [Paenibacillus sp. PK3_47]|nr:hypothetical protein [Paenibacillus sp. PK3_47]